MTRWQEDKLGWQGWQRRGRGQGRSVRIRSNVLVVQANPVTFRLENLPLQLSFFCYSLYPLCESDNLVLSRLCCQLDITQAPSGIDSQTSNNLTPRRVCCLALLSTCPIMPGVLLDLALSVVQDSRAACAQGEVEKCDTCKL
eukprot:767125-Hanusia_phi.AAC.4